MPLRLLRFGFSREYPEPRMCTRHDSLKSGYDVAIIGGGGHAHTDSAMRTMRWRAEVNKHYVVSRARRAPSR